jgi:hypothetical protein
MQPVVISARMVMVVLVVDGSLLQATRETCSRVQLQQLLQHDLYPEDDAAVLAAQARGVLIFVKTVSRAKAVVKCRDDQARARVLIFVKTVSRAKVAVKCRDDQARADHLRTLQRNLVIGGALGATLVCIFVVWKRRQ